MRFTFTIAFAAAGFIATQSQAQTVWDQFSDDPNISTSICGVVNAENAELVVLSDTAQLMIVTQNDTILTDTFVDANNNVLFENQPAGFIEFFEDGDGFRTLWWVALNGQVVAIDPFTAAPSASSARPTDFTDVACDACEFVDAPPADVCEDGGDDGGIVLPPIEINLCGTMGDEMAASMVFFGAIGLKRTNNRRRRR